MKRLIAVFLVLALPAASHAQIGSTSTTGTPAFGGEAAAPAADAPAAEAPAAATTAPADAPREASASAPVAVGNDYTVDAAPTIMGATGLMRTYQAGGLETGTLGLSLQLEYFKGSNIVRRDDEVSRFLGHIGVSWTPLDFLEVWFTGSGRAVRNSQGLPEVIQSVADLNFGLKGFYGVNDWLSVGGLLNVNLPAGANRVGTDFSGTGLDILALSTFDLRSALDIPMRAHLNVGYRLDNSANLFDFELDRVERFGQGIYGYDRIFLGVSVDAPMKYITPFAEWTLEWPNGAACDGTIDQGCVGEIGFASYPSFLTVGARTEPVNGLSFNVGVDMGLTTAESQGTPAIPAWNFLIGAAYNLNPRPAQVVEVPVEVPVAVGSVMSHVEGVIRESGSQAPIAGARIRYVDTDFTDQITGDNGRFRTFDFEPGTGVVIEVSHPEYVTREMAVTITEEVLSGPIDMEPSFTGALVQGTVGTTGPAEVTVSLRGEQNYDIVADEDGAFEMEIEPGQYRVIVHAPGHQSARDIMTLDAGRHTIDESLSALSATAQFRFTGDGFGPANADARIDFAADGSLTPEAIALLDGVVALLAAEGTGRVLVRSHTDPKETIEEELNLTTNRATAVIDYLVGQGVSAARLEADGVGAAEPLFPNIADRNRRRNNRVEFEFLY